MGNYLAHRRNNGAEEIEGNSSSSQAYLYPTKSGLNYFSSHFIMGGERFETVQPECYLFGENLDLNFLGGRPTPFPYSAPLPHEPTRTLRALINIRKESLRFVKVLKNHLNSTVVTLPPEDPAQKELEADADSKIPPPKTIPVKQTFTYNIEFTFDTDVRCAITIHYFCSEEITSNGVFYHSRDSSFNSETYYFKRGSNQTFSQTTHLFEPSKHDEDDMMYRAFDDLGHFDPKIPLPVVIHCQAQEGDEPRQSHSLIAVVERNQDGSFSLKPFKQKIFVDGLCYLLQEIYGIENKAASNYRSDGMNYSSLEEELFEDSGSECVICMSDSRDTLILPCRHLCLCNACADSLRYQANNCPICRSPFRALLQIRAVRKSNIQNSVQIGAGHHPHQPITTSNVVTNAATLSGHVLSDSTNDLVDIPPGFESLSLLEALNGPNNSHNQSGHGMYAFRPDGDVASSLVTGQTPTGRRSHPSVRSKRGQSEQSMIVRDSSSSNALTPSNVRRTGKGLTNSPSTPEVVVSARPISPDKTVKKAISSKIEAEDNWQVPISSKIRENLTMAADLECSSSSNSSTSSGHDAAKNERTRLLPPNDKNFFELPSSLDNDLDVEQQLLPKTGHATRSRKSSSDSHEHVLSSRPHSFKGLKGKSPNRKTASRSSVTEICSPVDSTSLGQLVSLRDGFDEQRCMTDTDLMSTATGSVANFALLGNSKELEGEQFENEVEYCTAASDLTCPSSDYHVSCWLLSFRMLI